MADAGDSKSPAPRGHAGSIPASGTTIQAGSFEVGRGGRQEPSGASCRPLAFGAGFRPRESLESIGRGGPLARCPRVEGVSTRPGADQPAALPPDFRAIHAAAAI